MKYDLDSYKSLLENAVERGYSFHLFDNIQQSVNSCLLRHDIDVSVFAALKMAEVEKELNVKSTYFFMLRSPCYNLFSRKNVEYVKTILKLGHSIGLHYDQGFDELNNVSLEDTTKRIFQEQNILEQEFSTSVSAVSFHQPNRKILEEKIDCGDLVNTYDKVVLEDYIYFSDSNRSLQMAMDTIDFSNSLANLFPQNIQLLIHPMWWVFNGNETIKVWDNALESNIQQMEVQLLETERAFGHKRLSIF